MQPPRFVRPSLAALVALGLIACKDEAPKPSPRLGASHTRAEIPQPEPPPEPPARVLLAWDTKLRVAPEQYAPALTLAPPAKDELEGLEGDRALGRVVEVRGKADDEGRWWTLAPGTGIEGLEFYSIPLYVPAGTGRPIEPPADAPTDPPTDPPSTDDPVPTKRLSPELEELGMLAAIGTVDSNDVPVQTGRTRPDALVHEWHVDHDAKVFWPNGELAGSVVRTHAFIEAGETKRAGGRELTCFAARIGPGKPATELCFDPSAVRETEPPRAIDEDIWGSLTADDEVYGVGGFGYVGGTPSDGEVAGILGVLEADEQALDELFAEIEAAEDEPAEDEPDEDEPDEDE